MNKKERPNILFIITDQQRFDSLGCYGADWVKTPNLDGLARDGIMFKNCYANNPVCTPSRASIFTGKPITSHGVYRLHDILPEDEVLFTKHLHDAGYRTALFGKLHVSGRIYEAEHRHPNDGFDEYQWCMEPGIHMDSPLNGYSRWLREINMDFYRELKEKGRKLKHIPVEYHFTHWAAEQAVRFIENSDNEQPFFCMMSVFDPHNPYDDYPENMLEFVEEDGIPEPLTAGISVNDRPGSINREMNHSYLGSFNRYSFKDLMEMRKGYYASIALIDLEVGRVLNALKARDLEKNTLVIFTSDHGDMLGDHCLLVKGAFFYEPAVKVPLILKWPRMIKPGIEAEDSVQLNDLAATVLSAAGFDKNSINELMPESRDLLKEKASGNVIVCYRNTGINGSGLYWNPPIHATMIRKGGYKLSYYHSDREGELYNLTDDPFELNNLWSKSSYLSIRRELMDEFADWMLKQELTHGSRGGSAFPKRRDRLVNTIV